MDRIEFAKYIAAENKCTQKEAEKVIKIFTSSVISAISEGKEVFLHGFGNFKILQVQPRQGSNIYTKELTEIPAHNQVRFHTSKTIRDAANKR